MLGPELHTRKLTDVFAFLEGSTLEPKKPEEKKPEGEEKKPEEVKPVIDRVNVGFSIASDVPTGTIALVGGKLVT